jgi:hypothetical protein
MLLWHSRLPAESGRAEPLRVAWSVLRVAQGRSRATSYVASCLPGTCHALSRMRYAIHPRSRVVAVCRITFGIYYWYSTRQPSARRRRVTAAQQELSRIEAGTPRHVHVILAAVSAYTRTPQWHAQTAHLRVQRCARTHVQMHAHSLNTQARTHARTRANTHTHTMSPSAFIW